MARPKHNPRTSSNTAVSTVIGIPYVGLGGTIRFACAHGAYSRMYRSLRSMVSRRAQNPLLPAVATAESKGYRILDFLVRGYVHQ